MLGGELVNWSLCRGSFNVIFSVFLIIRGSMWYEACLKGIGRSLRIIEKEKEDRRVG